MSQSVLSPSSSWSRAVVKLAYFNKSQGRCCHYLHTKKTHKVSNYPTVWGKVILSTKYPGFTVDSKLIWEKRILVKIWNQPKIQNLHSTRRLLSNWRISIIPKKGFATIFIRGKFKQPPNIIHFWEKYHWKNPSNTLESL